MGKGWAKGLTAKTDARVARAAAAHKGRRYVRRTRPEDCRWPGSPVVRDIAPLWTPQMAYVVGLLATDGCLISGRRQIAFVSEDRELCAQLLSILSRRNKIRATGTRTGGTAYRVQFGAAALYRWLVGIGLHPRKSLTLGAIDVGDEHFIEVVGGLLDGDGSVEHYWYDGTGKARGHRYEALRVRFGSASAAHISWLRERIRTFVGINGWIVRTAPTATRHAFFQLGYGSRESRRLLELVYADANAPRLARKRAVFVGYLETRTA